MASAALTTEVLRAMRTLYEAGVSPAFIAKRLGLTERQVVTTADDAKWSVTKAARDEWESTVKVAAEKLLEDTDVTTSLVIDDTEVDALLEEIMCKERTIPERAALYEAMMSRVALRVGVIAMRMKDVELIKNVDALTKLDALARRSLSGGSDKARSGSLTFGGNGGGMAPVNVNVLASSRALPPMLAGDAIRVVASQRVSPPALDDQKGYVEDYEEDAD